MTINLIKPLIQISLVTMLSRVLGVIRDIAMAQIFGVNMMTDAFFIAFKLSNLLRRIFAEGAVHQVFLPVLSEYKCSNTKKEIQVFISRAFGLLITVLIIVIIVGLIIAPWVITIIAPGFCRFTEKFFITILMFRIMFPYILFISSASLVGSILNTWNFFLAPAFTPILLNMSMIGYIFFSDSLSLNYPIIGLAWSVIIGGILQCIYYLPFLKKVDLLVIPTVNFYDNKIRRICRSMGCIFISVSSSQISLVINTILSSFLKDGSISWMYYADRIMELPVGMFGSALTTILLPYLSKFYAKKNNVEYLNLMNWGIRVCCLLGFPSAVILGVLAQPIIITLFQYGKFSEFDVLMVQHSVIVYSFGLPGLILVKVLTSGFYARHDLKVPMCVIIVTIIFAQCINLICIHSLQHVVFSVSISLGAWLNAGLLFWQLKRKYLFQLQFRWVLFFSRLGIALFVMYIILYIGLMILSCDWLDNSFFYRFYRIITVLILGIMSYFIALRCLGMRMRDFSFLSKDVS